MVKNGKRGTSADVVAGIIVLIVALGLLAVVIYAVNQWTQSIPAPTARPTSTTTSPPTEPPAPTLVPNPFEKDAFTYDENGYLTCLTAESWLGVDVSEHQGQINWEEVASADIKFAMVRLAYRGWGAEGMIREDQRGLENLDAAAIAGLQVGVYFFSQAVSVEEAIEEARFVLQLLDGRELDMPVVFDWETVSSEEARTANMNAATLNACALAFCQEIETAGYTPMVYFNLDLAKWGYDLLAIQQAGYDFWLAMYNDKLNYPHRVKMWQYTSDGAVPGIKGRVDIDLFFP